MATVGCAGILVSDTFCGPMKALPRQGELLAIDEIVSSAGGCAANVAIGLALQGTDVDVAGCVGDDAEAEQLVSELSGLGVGCARVTRLAHLPTSRTVILVTEGEDRRYIHSFGANSAFGVEHLDREWLASLDLFYLGGLFALPGMDMRALADTLAFCRSAGTKTVVDVVAPDSAEGIETLSLLLPHTDFFVPNADEASALTGLNGPVEQIERLQSRGARAVVVTCGESGAVAGSDGRFWRVPAHELETVDPSGSGDAFTAGMITGISRRLALADLLRFGSALGASAARAVGTTKGVFRARELEEFLAANPIEITEIQCRSK